MKLYPNITAYFFIWIFCLLVVFAFGLSGKDLTANLANWDGGHYLSIAQNGYRQNYQYAFFPLYPMAIWLVNQVTGNDLVAALIVSITSSFFALQLLFKLISLDFNKKLAEKTILFLLIFPTSFFLITAYSEGLFLFLTIAAFYFLRKQKLFYAVFFAALASATRLAGLALVVALIVTHRKNWLVYLAPLGFIIYCIYIFKATGDPFYFITAESNHWQRNLAIPGFSFWETLKEGNYIELIFGIFGLGMVLRSFRFLPIEYSIYGLLSILIPTTTSSLVSIPRFLLPIFPIFILLGMIKNPKIIFFIQLVSVLFLSSLSILFINGFWAS